MLVKGAQQRIWAYHDGVDLGGPAMARVAKDYGYTLEQLRKLQDGECMSTTLRAEFFFDEEACTWHFRVPALHVNGGGTPTREAAERECLAAIAFALEGNPDGYDGDAQAVSLDVSVVPAA